MDSRCLESYPVLSFFRSYSFTPKEQNRNGARGCFHSLFLLPLFLFLSLFLSSLLFSSLLFCPLTVLYRDDQSSPEATFPYSLFTSYSVEERLPFPLPYFSPYNFSSTTPYRALWPMCDDFFPLFDKLLHLTP